MRDNGYSSGMEKAKGFVAGLLVGGAIGAGTALLKAPRSGEETREQIRHKASEAQDKAGETVQQLLDRAEAVSDQVKDRAEELRAQARDVGDDVAQQAEELGDQVTSRVEDGKKRLSKVTK